MESPREEEAVPQEEEVVVAAVDEERLYVRSKTLKALASYRDSNPLLERPDHRLPACSLLPTLAEGEEKEEGALAVPPFDATALATSTLPHSPSPHRPRPTAPPSAFSSPSATSSLASFGYLHFDEAIQLPLRISCQKKKKKRNTAQPEDGCSGRGGAAHCEGGRALETREGGRRGEKNGGGEERARARSRRRRRRRRRRSGRMEGVKRERAQYQREEEEEEEEAEAEEEWRG